LYFLFCNPANKHFALSCNGNEYKNPVVDPNANSNHHQKLANSLKITAKSKHGILVSFL